MSSTELRAEQRSLMRLLLGKDELAIGTVYKVNKRCGSPYCHCKEGPGHPQTFFMFSEKGKRRCKLVRQADVPKMRKAADRYKKCRDAIRGLEMGAVDYITKPFSPQILLAKIKKNI